MVLTELRARIHGLRTIRWFDLLTEFESFMHTVREESSSGAYIEDDLFSSPILPEIDTEDGKAYFEIEFSMKDDCTYDYRLKCKYRRHDLYLVGCQIPMKVGSKRKKWFAFDDTQKEIPGAVLLGFKSSYSSMGGLESQKFVGATMFETAIKDLVGKRKYTKKSLMSLIIMTSESGRFRELGSCLGSKLSSFLNEFQEYSLLDWREDWCAYLRNWANISKLAWEAGEMLTFESEILSTQRDSLRTVALLKACYVNKLFQLENDNNTVIDPSTSLEQLNKFEELYAIDRLEAYHHPRTYWLLKLRQLEVRVPAMIVGCKLDLRDDGLLVELHNFMSPIMQRFPEIETCTERSGCKHIQVNCFKVPLQPYQIEHLKRVVQQKMPEGVDESGLTLRAFVWLIERRQPEIVSTVPRKFGYNNDIRLDDDLLPPAFINVPDQGSKKFLVLREIPEDKVKMLLSYKESLAACDTAISVIDGSDELSWKKTAHLLVEVSGHWKDTGYDVPSLIVAAENDLNPYRMEIHDSTRFSQEMGIEVPETEAWRSTKQHLLLVNRSVVCLSDSTTSPTRGSLSESLTSLIPLLPWPHSQLTPWAFPSTRTATVSPLRPTCNLRVSRSDSTTSPTKGSLSESLTSRMPLLPRPRSLFTPWAVPSTRTPTVSPLRPPSRLHFSRPVGVVALCGLAAYRVYAARRNSSR